MRSKIQEKEKAIQLREKGLSYREILAQIPVAKSSLSLWLKDVTLLPGHAYRITEKRLASARRGALKKKEKRIALTKEIKDKARVEIGKLSERELWLIGIALYWAEGSKEKEYRPGSRTVFYNSDPFMINVYLKWLLKIVRVDRESIVIEVVLHENNRHRIKEVVDHWIKSTGFPKEFFERIYFKRHKINTKRKNIGNNYFGLLRISVKKSSSLNRKIQGWIEGMYHHSGVV